MDADQEADFSAENPEQSIPRLLSASAPGDWRRSGPLAAAMGLALILIGASTLHAGNAPDMLPDTAIAPADTGSAPATPAPRHLAHPARTPAPSSGESAQAGGSTVPVVHHHATPGPSPTPVPNLVFEVEPADARVPLRNNTIAYLQPSKQSPQLEQLEAGQLVHVTGSTRFFLQVKLRNGSTAYVLAEDVNLTVPADKIFRLTSDTRVLARPNKWAKQLAEVHQGHDVHVVGVALNYMRIRMKSGLEGYITVSALE
jgi:hypothetical protein